MLTVIGEALVDVVRPARGGTDREFAGGSPLNVAVGLARLEHPVQFIGRRGDDAAGRLIDAHLAASGVIASLPPDALPTSRAIASLGEDGAASYAFEIDGELPALAARGEELLRSATLVHTGSIAAVLEPGASQVIDAVEHARPHATISFDPNCRPAITSDPEAVRPRIEQFVALADIVKASDEDLAWLYPGVDPLDSARRWLTLGGPEGPALVVVTLGAAGAWAGTPGAELMVDPVPVVVADTVGAGDSFMAALLSAIVDRDLDGGQRRPELRRLGLGEVGDMVGYAARAAAITVSRPGADPPTRAELAAFAAPSSQKGA